MYNTLRMFDMHKHIPICLTLRMFSKNNIYIYICNWEMEEGIFIVCAGSLQLSTCLFFRKRYLEITFSKAFILKYTEH